MIEEYGGNDEEEQHKLMNLILDKEINNLKMRSTCNSIPDTKQYYNSSIEETSPILIRNYSNQKVQMDDPTLREVLGVMETPETNIKSLRKCDVNQNKNIENEGYRLNRQLQ